MTACIYLNRLSSTDCEKMFASRTQTIRIEDYRNKKRGNYHQRCHSMSNTFIPLINSICRQSSFNSSSTTSPTATSTNSSANINTTNTATNTNTNTNTNTSININTNINISSNENTNTTTTTTTTTSTSTLTTTTTTIPSINTSITPTSLTIDESSLEDEEIISPVAIKPLKSWQSMSFIPMERKNSNDLSTINNLINPNANTNSTFTPTPTIPMTSPVNINCTATTPDFISSEKYPLRIKPIPLKSIPNISDKHCDPAMMELLEIFTLKLN